MQPRTEPFPTTTLGGGASWTERAEKNAGVGHSTLPSSGDGGTIMPHWTLPTTTVAVGRPKAEGGGDQLAPITTMMPPPFPEEPPSTARTETELPRFPYPMMLTLM